MAPAWANGATATGMATATVVHPIAVTQMADLDFGIVISDSGRAGSVTIAPGGPAIRYAGGARLGCGGRLACPKAHAGLFGVTGQANSTYSIAVPSNISVRGISASEALSAEAPLLVVTGITARTESRPAAGSVGQLGANGRDRFSLGGTLNVTTKLPPARYRVSIPVVVTYN